MLQAQTMAGYIFAFDLDGTVTRREILPRIAALLGLEEEVAALTQQTLCGVISFEDSLRRRVAMLRGIPLRDVQAAVAQIPLDPDITAFITANRAACAIVTGNLDCWVAPLLERLGCRAFTSRASFRNSALHLDSILNKAEAVTDLRAEGKTIVAIGESVNDIPMFERADIGIAFGGVHAPVPEIQRLARHHAHSGKALCLLLKKIQTGEAKSLPTPDLTK